MTKETPFTLSAEQQRTLDEMKEAKRKADLRLAEKWAAMTEEERRAAVQEASHMADKMVSGAGTVEILKPDEED